MSSGNYRPDIDGLRAVAVAPVVLYHAGAPAFSGGFVGVDVFFVISGYLIGRILIAEMNAGAFSIISFYERRARRILPALVVVLLASLAAGFVLAWPDQLTGLAGSTLATLAFGSNFWFWRAANDYFAAASDFEPLLHTWSLAVEEQFYLLFPPILWLLFRAGPRFRAAAIWALCLGSFALAAYAVERAPAFAFYLAPTRAWEIGVGVLLALASQSATRPSTLPRTLVEIVAAAGLAAILTAVFAYDAQTPFPGIAALAPCLGTAAIIWAGERSQTWTGRVLSIRPMVFVGLISYSLYLWHWPVLAFLRIRLESTELPSDLAASAVLLSVVFATLSWAVVERPFRRKPPHGPSRRAIFTASAAVSTALAALAAGVIVGHGLPQRFSEPVQNALAGATDYVGSKEWRCVIPSSDERICRTGGRNAMGAPEEVTRPNAPADFLLWGDSHAQAIFAAAASASEAAGMSGLLMSKFGCPPLIDIERQDRTPRLGCAEYADRVLETLLSRNNMKTVILAARWTLYAESDRPPGEDGKPVVLFRSSDTEELPNGDGNFERLSAALQETIRTISESGRQVVIIGSVPEVGFHVPQSLARRLRDGGTPQPVNDVGAINRRNARVDRLFSKMAELNAVRFLELTPAFCSASCVIASEDGKPYYYDGNHLSVHGADVVVEPLLKPIFGAP